MKIVVYNLGCKVNQYESDSLAHELIKAGHSVSLDLEYAEVYVLNTCAVTNEAEKKSRQAIARCNKLNPNSTIYVCGCASQNNSVQFYDKTNVVYISGVASKMKIPELIRDNIINSQYCQIDELPNEYEDNYHTEQVRTRAYIKIQDGCNNYCSYCLIPYLRGRSRSRSIDSIVEECERLAQNVREIVITGIDISSYGLNIGTSLVQLINALQHIKVRVRLGSLEVNIISRELLESTKGLYAFCPHFHLSLQSGCDDTLLAMNRHYTTQEYRDRVDLIREFYPLASLTTDLICGFPTETEEQFQSTLRFVDEIKFSDMHIFAYSKRDGTKASQLKGLEKYIIQNRCKLAEIVASRNKIDYEHNFLGRQCEVLVEDRSGYTREYVRVNVTNPYPNSLQNVTPTKFINNELCE